MTESSLFVRYLVNINNIAPGFNRMGWHAAFKSLSHVTFLTSDTFLATAAPFRRSRHWSYLNGWKFSSRTCHCCLQRCSTTIFTECETHVLISGWSIKYSLDSHVPAHTHLPAYCGKWIISSPAACHHKSHNTNIFGPLYVLSITCWEFIYGKSGLHL